MIWLGANDGFTWKCIWISSDRLIFLGKQVLKRVLSFRIISYGIFCQSSSTSSSSPLSWSKKQNNNKKNSRKVNTFCCIYLFVRPKRNRRQREICVILSPPFSLYAYLSSISILISTFHILISILSFCNKLAHMLGTASSLKS